MTQKEEHEISDEAKERAKNYMALKGALEIKEETLEKAAIKYRDSTTNKMGIEVIAFIKGAHWQAERMYSEEDLKEAFESAREFNSLDGVVDVHIVLPMGGDMSDLQPLHLTFKEWFEQHKKK